MPKKQLIPKTVSLDVFADDRGTFIPIYQQSADFPAVKRTYSVYNHGKNVVRGFHFHEKEWKLFSIVAGAAKFVAVNPINPEEKYTFVSSVRKPQLIIIPPGFANGWVSLEDETVLVCCSSSTLQESLHDDRRYDPYLWGDVWSIKGR